MIIFFDLETTGVSTTKDRIVQISAVKVDKDFNIIPDTKKKLLINPEMPIPAGATKVHGITDEMVKGQPNFKSYATSMFNYFDGCVVAGYNISVFDVPLLSEEFGRCGLTWPAKKIQVLDSFKIFRIKEKRDLASALRFYTGEVMEGAHDAENDNLATIKILKGQLKMYPDLSTMDIDALHEFCCDGVKTLDLAGKIGINEQGQAYYTFGKDSGKTVKENPGFASWMLKNDFPADTKSVINKLLK